MSDRASSSILQPEDTPLTVLSMSTSTGQIPEPTTEVRIKEEDTTAIPSLTASVAKTGPSPDAPSHSPTRVWRTEGQRKAVFRNDPQVQEVEPRRVLCRVCERWIKLSLSSDYTLGNWLAHKQRCSPATPILRASRSTPIKPHFSPGSRVATAERKIVLLNDPQVKVCSSRRVQCGNCMSVVTLEGAVDYELTKWTEHKEKCKPMTPAPITPRGPASHRSRNPPLSTSSTHSRASADVPRRSPSPVAGGESSQSTETTAVAESSPAAVKIGTKRVREEPEDEEEVEKERPMNRARTEGLVGWLMAPLKEFARGFREGLGST